MAHVTLKRETGVNLHIPPDTEYRKRTVRVGQVLGTVKNLNIVYMVVPHEKNAQRFYDEELVANLISEYDMGV